MILEFQFVYFCCFQGLENLISASSHLVSGCYGRNFKSAQHIIVYLEAEDSL